MTKKGSKFGPCLRGSLRLLKKHPDWKLMMGPPGYPSDTSHFWVVDNQGKVHETTPDRVPRSYKYKGKEVDPVSISLELKMGK